tara:strand:- start:1772 stop:1993 length:222 start_codon:yes stop_codon:yes gene_type:complete
MDIDKALKHIGGIVILAIVIIIGVYLIKALIWLGVGLLYLMMVHPLGVLIGGFVSIAAIWYGLKIRDGYFRNK